MKRSDKIWQYFETRNSEMLEFLKVLVRYESPSHSASSQQIILDILSDKIKSLGYSVFKMPGATTGGFVMGRPVNRSKDTGIQLMIGHCDTVWDINTLRNMPLTSTENRLNGPGVYDMKAGLTQMIYSLQAIEDLNLSPDLCPVILINSDEEIGSRESTSSIKRLAKIAERAFVMEPPLGLNGKLKTSRKGLGRFTIVIKGKSAHAGLNPEQGASAIIELSYQIQRLFSLNDPVKGITVNVGLIEGGISPNVVAPESKAVIDVRVLTHEDGAYLTEVIKGLQPVNPDVSLHIEGGIGRPPMEKTSRNVLLWQTAKDVAEKMGITIEQGVAGGGSDGNTTSLYTATLDGLGIPGDGAHANHEFIFTDRLTERCTLLTLLLLEPSLHQSSDNKLR